MQLLHHGSHADLYFLEKPEYAEPVVLKIPHASHTSVALQADLNREYAVGQVFRHPLSRKVLEKCFWQGKPALILEHIPGQTLAEYFATPRNITEFLEIAIQIAQVLHSLHQQKWVHNQIHPGHLLIDSATGQIHLIDFGQARPFELQALDDMPRLPENLAYLSPEQTRRVPHPIDGRSDLYAFGITLYELLTGQLPFSAEDTLGWIHAHLALNPPPPHTLIPEPLPGGETLSRIVLKLLAKHPADRYASAQALETDLQRCLQGVKALGRLPDFAPAVLVTNMPFRLNAKLYGREAELAHFEQAIRQAGMPHQPVKMIQLVGGSGLGKTRLLQELYPMVQAQGGMLLQGGKYDQNYPPTPYQAFTLAFTHLIRQVLQQTSLGEWKARFQHALGPDASELIPWIPQLELLLGKKPSHRSGPENPKRLPSLFLRLFQSLASPEQPLILVVDDLQWADEASLELFHQLLQAPEICHLLIVGSCREQSPDPAHPLNKLLQKLRAEGLQASSIYLKPLQVSAIQDLIAGSLGCSPAQSLPLAEWVFERTAGNALFVRELLHLLHDKGSIRFDAARSGWDWSLKEIQQSQMSSNVLELLKDKMSRLSVFQQDLLKQAACLGQGFDLNTLGQISGLSEAEIRQGLRQALEWGLIQPVESVPAKEGCFRFVHDQIQLAAYALLADKDKLVLHALIGSKWLEAWPLADDKQPAQADQQSLYEGLFHLNLAVDVLPATIDRLRLARLNLHAAQQILQAGGYQACLDYVRAGLQAIPDDCWQTDYVLSFELCFQQAKAQVLLDLWQDQAQTFALLWQKARTLPDKCRVSTMQMSYYAQKNQHHKVVSLFEEAMAAQQMAVPRHPLQFWGTIALRMNWIRRFLKQSSHEDLQRLPEMSNEDLLLRGEWMGAAFDAVGFTQASHYLIWMSVELTYLSLKHGTIAFSPVAFCALGMALLFRFRDQEGARKLMELSRWRMARTQDKVTQAKVMTCLAVLLMPYFVPLQECLYLLRQGLRQLLSEGEPLLIVYNCLTIGYYRIYLGHDLQDIYKESSQNLKTLHKARHSGGMDLLWATQMVPLQELTGEIEDLGWECSEAHFLSEYSHLTPFLLRYQIQRLTKAYLFGDALAGWVEAAEAALVEIMTLIDAGEGDFFLILAWLELARQTPVQASGYLKKARLRMEQYVCLDKMCAVNFHSRYMILTAEFQHAEGRTLQALESYALAMTQAEADGNPFVFALAAQRAGETALSVNLRQVAQTYLKQAHQAYGHWGAQALMAKLEERYPQLICDIQVSDSRQKERANHLDYQSLVKASQTLSEELEFNVLVTRLLEIVRENAGAQRVVLLLEEEDGWFLASRQDEQQQDTWLKKQALESVLDLPLQVLRYVLRTQEVLCLTAARQDADFAFDPYIQNRQILSLLTLPLLKQGKLIGLLYLENNLLAGAFAQHQVQTLRLLAAQAAISLAHARLYQRLQIQNQALEATVQLRTQDLAAVNAELTTHNVFLERLNSVKDDFLNMVSHDLKNPLNNILLFSRYMESRTLSQEKTKEIGQMISRASRRMFRLIEDLLDLNRLEQGKLKLNSESILLRDWLAECLQEFYDKAAEKKQTLRLENQDQELWLQADAVRLRQVLENLLSNALKFSPEHTLVRVQLETQDETVLIRVIDQGPGLSAQEQQYLFTPFAKLSPQPTGGEHSTGLGLSIVKKLVEAMGGDVWCESQMGQGCTFLLAFPLAKDPSGDFA